MFTLKGISHTTAKVSAIAFGLLGTLAVAHSANAASLNLTNWDILGDVTTSENQVNLSTASSIETDDYGLNAPAGTFNFSGNDPVDVMELKHFLGLSARSLDPSNATFGTFEGSAIKQTFMAKAGDVLTFDWNFLSNDSVLPDYAFVILNDVFSSLADTSSVLSTSSFFKQETGVQKFAYTFDADGEYTLALGVVDVDDFDSSSALSIENVELTTTTSTSVPEPTSVLSVLVFGILGAASILKRTQKYHRNPCKERAGIEF